MMILYGFGGFPGRFWARPDLGPVEHLIFPVLVQPPVSLRLGGRRTGLAFRFAALDAFCGRKQLVSLAQNVMGARPCRGAPFRSRYDRC